MHTLNLHQETSDCAIDLQSGAWDDVSGESFLRNLLCMPLEHAKWTTVSYHMLLLSPSANKASSYLNCATQQPGRLYLTGTLHDPAQFHTC